MESISLFLVSACYGGLAQARHLKSLMALRSACRTQATDLALNFAGSEALASRGQARWLAKFLTSTATHLILAEGEAAFTPEEVFELVAGGDLSMSSTTAQGVPRIAVISRRAAERLTAHHSAESVGFSDVGYARDLRGVMVFEATIEAGAGRYLDGFAALERRWREIAP